MKFLLRRTLVLLNIGRLLTDDCRQFSERTSAPICCFNTQIAQRSNSNLKTGKQNVFFTCFVINLN